MTRSRFVVRRCLVAACALAASTAVWPGSVAAHSPQQNRPQIRVSVTSPTAYLGQPFEYQIRVSDIREPDPVFTPPSGLKVESLGPPGVESRMSIVNGVVSSSRTTVFRYRVTPQSAGKFLLPAPVVSSGNKQYRGRDVEIDVIAPKESPLVRISAITDRSRIYPMQRFEVELRVDLKELEKPWAVISPVSSRILNQPPALLVPWLDDGSLPDGILPTRQPDVLQWVTRDGSGFTLNGLRRFSLLTFLPDEQKIETSANGAADERPDPAGPDKTPATANNTGETTTWLRYVFKRSFVAKKAGVFELGRATLRGGLVKSIVADRRVLEDVFVVSSPVRVDVTPLPLDSRPDSWVGVIGDLDVESRIAPTTAAVGQPLTLTLTLTGTGTLTDAFPPDLSKIPEIHERFRVYEATSKPTREGRTFTYSLRPKQPGEVVFPPVELSWFDPLLEEYVTGKTSAIPLQITGTVRPGDAEVLAPAGGAEGVATLKTNDTGIYANLTAVSHDRVEPRVWFQAWAGLLAVCVVAWLLLGRDTAAAKAERRKRQVVAAAEQTFGNGLRAFADGNFAAGAAALRTAVSQLVGAFGEDRGEGLTVEELTGRLSAMGFPDELVQATGQLLRDCEAARYGGGAAQLEPGSQAESTIADLMVAAHARSAES